MNTDNFLIEDIDLETAQNICKTITDSNIRNRAVANAIGANIASKLFDKETVDTESGLHYIDAVLEDIEISDIYINNCYIDVRVYFDEDEMAVPKSQFDNNLLPYAYMFIKLNEDLSGGTVTGFIMPENINRSADAAEFYPVDETSLVSFYDIEPILTDEGDTYAIEDAQVFAYLDGTLSDKNSFYAALLKSADGRIKLAKAAKAQYIFNFVSIPDNISETIDTEIDNMYNGKTNIEDLSDFIDNDTVDELQPTDTTEESPDLTGDNPSFEYKTVTSPSLENIEETPAKSSPEFIKENEDESIPNITEEDLEATIQEEEEIPVPETKEAQSLNTLFTNVSNNDTATVDDFKPVKQNNKKLLPAVGLLIILGALGYFGYTKYMPAPPSDEETQNNVLPQPSKPSAQKQEEEAMPVESITAEQPKTAADEGFSETIPAIEQNLDASILVSNLKVNWEVPEGYASNTAAKRYLVKLGKIIQLNLKTELLLLNKPPITNKISIELKFDAKSKKFETVGVVISSGEKTVDDLIIQTVNKALVLNLNSNTDSFSKLQGNPILVIHL